MKNITIKDLRLVGIKNVDIANALGTKRLVFWSAREGTYIREAKDPKMATGWMVEYINPY